MEVSPFTCKTNWTKRSAATCFFMHWSLLAPLRFLIALVVFMILPGTICYCLGRMGGGPPPGSNYPPKTWARISFVCEWACKGWCLVMGYKVTVHGKQDPSARVLVANHHTPFDIPLLQAAGLVFHPVSLDKITKIPVAGLLVRNLLALTFDRENPKERRELLRQGRKRVRDATFSPTLVFPEGTTCNTKVLPQFKTGAVRMAEGRPIQPITIKIEPEEHRQAWVPYNGLNPIQIMWFQCWQLARTHVTITMMDVVTGNKNIQYAVQYEPAFQLTEEIRVRMAMQLNVETSAHRIEDMSLACMARDKFQVGLGPNFEPTVGPIFSKIQYHFPNIPYKKVEEQLGFFLGYQKRSPGKITDFLEYLKIVATEQKWPEFPEAREWETDGDEFLYEMKELTDSLRKQRVRTGDARDDKFEQRMDALLLSVEKNCVELLPED